MFGPSKKNLTTDGSVISDALERRLEPSGIFPNKEEVVNFLKANSRRVYLGIDPTGPDIHLGHTIPLLFLKQLLDLGHKPVIVIGDFTARIGDPTGKDATRKPLTPEQIKENSKDYLEQIYKILPKGSFEVCHNGDWLDKLSFKDVVQLAGHVTVQQMLHRDMFQERLKSEKPIGLHEFLYPLMQGYDSVAMEIDGEVGGNDQTFNMLVGRDLEKKLINKDKVVFATRLLVDARSGKKMSKSEGNLIAVSDSPKDMFGKTMAGIPDEMIKDVFQLCTNKDMDWISVHIEEMKSEPYKYKKELGREIVSMYHGEKAGAEAVSEFEKVFSNKELPTDISELYGTGKSLIDFISDNNLVESRSEAKRLLEQKAVKVNSEIVTDWGRQLMEGDIVQVGSRKFAKIK
ncbi:MAG: tyrosine--tRNA ligase [Patescibacteria group bacterium]